MTQAPGVISLEQFQKGSVSDPFLDPCWLALRPVSAQPSCEAALEGFSVQKTAHMPLGH